jgi:hypothetical protein
MTVTEAFEVFKSELELPDRKQAEASKAQQDVRSRLATHLYVADSLLTGSYPTDLPFELAYKFAVSKLI